MKVNELHSSRETWSGFLLPCDRCSSCPAGPEDPRFAKLCDRSCRNACRDYRASDGNVTKLEEPDRNLPTRAAPGEAASEGACSRRRIREREQGSVLISVPILRANLASVMLDMSAPSCIAQDGCVDVFVVAKDRWGAPAPGITPPKSGPCRYVKTTALPIDSQSFL